MTWEVQTLTICDGWTNTWTVDEGAGEIPDTFATQEEAEAALAEFLAEMADEAACGQIAETADPDDYRVRKSRQIELHELDWQGIRIRVTYEADWLNMGDRDYSHAHLELESILPERAPLPMSGTGFRSHFTHAEAIDSLGGPVAFTEAWLEAEAAKPAWREYVRQSRQMTLF